jgi:regulator of protease activity HflC (stomatin/prohibitin superfamily)
MVEPGHRGLLFDAKNGGLQHEVLQPGFYRHGVCIVGPCPRVDDFDVTYSRHREDIHTTSLEGLALDLKLTVVYRPIVAELYQLDTEIGPNYYDEVVGPEFRSTARGVFARHSYLELAKSNEKIENEVEQELRRRIAGRHVEISSVLLEVVNYAPEIANAVRARLVGQEEAARQKAVQENEAARKKRDLEIRTEQERLAAEAAAAQKKLLLEQDAMQKKLALEQEAAQEAARIDLELKRKKAELELAQQQGIIDKQQAETRLMQAKLDAQARVAAARAKADEVRAEASGITPMHVMMHAYDALGKLGGTGTTIMLGDWSKLPSFLFPPSMMGAYSLPWVPFAPRVPPSVAGAAPPATPDHVYGTSAAPPPPAKR